MATSNSVLVIKRKSQVHAVAVVASVFLDNSKVASLSLGQEEKIPISSGEHSLYVQFETLIGNKPKSEIIVFNATGNAITATTYLNNSGKAICEFDEASVLTQKTQALSSEGALSLLESEKELLEKKISTPGMGAGTALVWLLMIFLVSGICSFLSSQMMDAEMGICTSVLVIGGGIIILGINFAKTNNKSALEERLRSVNLQIVKQRSENSTPQKVTSSSKKKESGSSTNSSNINSSDSSDTEKLEKELRRIKKLFDDDLITEEEYQDLRKKIMKSK